MRPLLVEGTNFQSYSRIKFGYNDLGPTLIAGPTGTGKSAALDVLCWGLFGITSKDSAADDVRCWFSDEPTAVMVEVALGDGTVIQINRIRGKRAAQNDLHFFKGDSEEAIRGKDAADTQKKIDALLGVNGALYTNAAYIHQFSKSDTFFVAQAKYRREIVESIRDLSAPVKFAERCAEEKKKLKTMVGHMETSQANLRGTHSALVSQLEALLRTRAGVAEGKLKRIAELEAAHASYEQAKEDRLMGIVSKLEELDGIIETEKSFETRMKSLTTQIKTAEKLHAEAQAVKMKLTAASTQRDMKTKELAKFKGLKGTCPSCLGPSDNEHARGHVAKVQKEWDELDVAVGDLLGELKIKSKASDQLEALKDQHTKLSRKQLENSKLVSLFESLKDQAVVMRDEESPYPKQIEEVRNRKDPYDAQIKTTEERAAVLLEEIESGSANLAAMEVRKAAAEWLYDASFQAKARMLTGAVQRLQDRTNEVLMNYFDGALRVEMKIEDGDKVEVAIQNDGYDCPFKQLSGGERCMLKLAFNVAYMEAAQDCAGVHVDTIMLDEALNGLDADLKVKAYGLIEHLAERHASVIVIEHSDEFKQMFPRTFLVSKEGSRSSVSELGI